jgi:hypothetical protein
MIPKNVHFIFGLSPDFGKRAFSYIHYLAIITAWKQLHPDQIFFHYEFEPHGHWWENAKQFVTLNEVKAPETIFGNPLISYQHKADVLRLELLKNMGGIYLDIDVITLNSFDNLLEHKNVMGIEPSVGLCNAVILAEKNSLFINEWYNTYKNFNKNNWNYHSIQIPLELANNMKDQICVESYYSFYYPFYKDTTRYLLWGNRKNYRQISITLFKNLLLKCFSLIPSRNIKYFPILHQFKSLQWHFEKMNRSYCIHLWETLWWHTYLVHITPETVLNNSTSLFSKLIRSRLAKEEICGFLK